MGITYSGRRKPASWGRRKDVGAATCGEWKRGARCVAPAAWPQALAVTTSQCIRIPGPAAGRGHQGVAAKPVRPEVTVLGEP